MLNVGWQTLLVLAIDWLIRIGLSIRVIMRRRPVGVSLAWIAVVLMLPLLGTVVYLMFGELRLGRARAARAQAIHAPYAAWLVSLRSRYPYHDDDDGTRPPSLARVIEAGSGYPPLPGNAIELLKNSEDCFREIVRDIEAAKSTCHLEFYIWSAGGRADDVVEALCRACARGVTVRVLVDSVGSAHFLASPQASRLRASGAELHAALPVRFWRFFLERFDLRLHRKIIVIDGKIGYTGSLNIADPRYFKADAGVGQWVDAMVRLRGPAVEALAVTFIEDWELETGIGLDALISKSDLRDQPLHGASQVQVIPSGPNAPPELMKAVLLQAIYAARTELVLTTPYFIADESILMALASAASRGVQVHLVIPKLIDSKLVALASQSFAGDLARAGVHIWRFHGGLLHTKSITVDGRFCLFGSLNLDPRSLVLNFEITLAIYDAEFTSELRALQETYIASSTKFDIEAWLDRSWPLRLAENAARLAGPLL